MLKNKQNHTLRKKCEKRVKIPLISTGQVEQVTNGKLVGKKPHPWYRFSSPCIYMVTFHVQSTVWSIPEPEGDCEMLCL